MSLREHARVRLLHDVVERGTRVPAGARGTIVHTYRGGAGFEVEFPDGAVVTVEATSLAFESVADALANSHEEAAALKRDYADRMRRARPMKGKLDYAAMHANIRRRFSKVLAYLSKH